MAGTTDWIVAVKQSAAWGTALAVGADDGIKITSETMSSGIPEPIKDENVGDALSGGTLQGNVTAEGTIVAPVRYKGPTSGLLMALLMGNSGAGGASGIPEVIEVATTFLHHMLFQNSNTGLFYTMVMDKGLNGADLPWEWPSVKLGQTEFGHADGKVMITPTNMARSVERASSINGDAQIALVTHVTEADLAIFNQITVFLQEITGAEDNADANDEILVTDAKMTINRNLSGDHESGSNAGYISEPETGGMPTAQMELTIADYKDNVDALIKVSQIIQPCRLPKIYKASLIWTGCEIPGTTQSDTFFMRFDIPAMTLADAPVNASGPGSKVPATLTFDINTPQVDTLPNGTDWAWVVAGDTPFRYQLQNDLASAILL